VETQRRQGIVLKLVGLAALVVRVEHESILAERFEQHHANGGSALLRAGGHGHCFGQEDPGLTGLGEPCSKKRDGIVSNLEFGDPSCDTGTHGEHGPEFRSDGHARVVGALDVRARDS
jgi:hypothetical protein